MTKMKLKAVIVGLVVGSIYGITTYAALSTGTLVIGDKAYSLNYANLPSSQGEISSEVAKGGRIYVKGFDNSWIDNVSSKAVDVEVIPKVTYKSKNGEVTEYSAKDGDKVSTSTSISVATSNFINSKQVVIKFSKAVDKVSAVNKDNYKIGEKALNSNDKVELSNDGQTATITLAESIPNDNISEQINVSKNLVDSDANSLATDYNKNILVLNKDSSTYTLPKNLVSDINVIASNETVQGSVIGDVYVYGSNDIINTSNIYGTLILDPGASGTATIKDVTSKNIDVKSGAESSIHLNNVKADTLTVNSSSNVRVVSEGTTKIENTVVTSYAILDSQSGSLGNVRVSQGGNDQFEVKLKGTFTEPIVVANSASITAETNAVVPKLKIASDDKNAKVSLKGTFVNVSIDKPANVQLSNSAKISGELRVNAAVNIETSDSAAVTKLNIATTDNNAIVQIKGNAFEVVVLNSKAQVNLATGITNLNVVAYINDTNLNITDRNTKINFDTKGKIGTISGDGKAGITNKDLTTLLTKIDNEVKAATDNVAVTTPVLAETPVIVETHTAASFTGIIIDEDCFIQYAPDYGNDTKACLEMKSCASSGYGIVALQSDGKYKYYYFDGNFATLVGKTFTKGTGSQLDAWNLAYATSKKDHITVKVTGTLDGTTKTSPYDDISYPVIKVSSLNEISTVVEEPTQTTTKVLNSIEISNPATKLVYSVGDKLDITGLQVTGTYSDNTKTIQSITTANISGFDSSVTTTSQAVTITVGGKTTTYPITINPLVTTTSVAVSGTVTLNGGNGNVTQGSAQVKDASGANVGSAVNPASDGKYTIANVPTGTGYTISITLAGYATGTIEAFNVTTSNVTGKNISLVATPAAVSVKTFTGYIQDEDCFISYYVNSTDSPRDPGADTKICLLMPTCAQSGYGITALQSDGSYKFYYLGGDFATTNFKKNTQLFDGTGSQLASWNLCKATTKKDHVTVSVTGTLNGDNKISPYDGISYPVITVSSLVEN